MTLRLDEDRPTRPKPPESVVETPGDGDQLCLDRAVEIRAAESRRALKTAVLVEDDAFAKQRGPREEIGEPGIAIAVFGKVHHGRAPFKR